MKTIDWKNYITDRPVINKNLLKPFALEISLLQSAYNSQLSAIKEKQRLELERLTLYKITKLDDVLKRHSKEIQDIECNYLDQISVLKMEQKSKIFTFGATFSSDSSPITTDINMDKTIEKTIDKHTVSFRFGTLMPKIYNIVFQDYSEIKHDLDNNSFNARINVISQSDMNNFSTLSCFIESEKSTEFYYSDFSKQLEIIKDSITDKLDLGDFFTTFHSNLNSKVLFHLMSEDSNSRTDCNIKFIIFR